MERKNAIKFLKGWGIATGALILAFPLILTPLVNAVDIPVAIFDALMIGGFVGWSIYTVGAIKAIYTVLKTNKSPTKTIKPTKTSKEDNSNSEYIKIDKKLFNTILIVLGVIVVFYLGYNSAGNSNTSEVNDDYADNSNTLIDNSTMSVEDYWKRGFEKYELEDYEGSIEDFNKAIEIDPNIAFFYYARGSAKNKLYDYEGSIEDFNKAIEINSDLRDAYNYRGYAKNQLEDHYGAIEDYTKAIELDPAYEAAYIGRGNAKEMLGDVIGTCKDWKKAADLGNEVAAEYYEQCIAEATEYLDRGTWKELDGDLKGACEDWKKAAALGNELAAEWVEETCN